MFVEVPTVPVNPYPDWKVREIIGNMPAIFYRYKFDGENIEKTEIAKKYPNMDAWSRDPNRTFEIRTIQPFYHKYSWLTSPWKIEFDKYDQRKKAVFLKEDDEKKAAKIFADFYYNQYVEHMNVALEEFRTYMDLIKRSEKE